MGKIILNMKDFFIKQVVFKHLNRRIEQEHVYDILITYIIKVLICI